MLSDHIVTPSSGVFAAVDARLRDVATYQHRLWMLLGRGQPRSVAELATALWYPEQPHRSARQQQARVGSFASHLNKHLAKYNVVVKPGVARRTYQTFALDGWKAWRATVPDSPTVKALLRPQSVEKSRQANRERGDVRRAARLAAAKAAVAAAEKAAKLAPGEPVSLLSHGPVYDEVFRARRELAKAKNCIAVVASRRAAEAKSRAASV